MSTVAVDLHYFPSLEFFAAIQKADKLVVFPDEIYQRQSFFNRTKIRLANKVETLSVPIQGRRPRIPQDKVKIDYTTNWEKIHLRGLQSGYGKAPFFEYYFPYFEQVFERKQENLWSLNMEILTICLKLLDSPAKIISVATQPNLTWEQDIRGQLKPSRHFSANSYYHPETYFQLFGSDFEPNLGILDLLFCEGPASKTILLKSAKKQ